MATIEIVNTIVTNVQVFIELLRLGEMNNAGQVQVESA